MKRKLKVTITRIKRTTGPAQSPASEPYDPDPEDVEKVIELLDVIRDNDLPLQTLDAPKQEKKQP